MRDAHFIEPMPCLAVKKLPEGEAWEYELKLDGYRALAAKRGGPVSFLAADRSASTLDSGSTACIAVSNHR